MLQHGEKREKSVTGNENDKSIKSYSAPLSTEQQFESSSIIWRFVTQVNSGQFSTFSYSWASLVPLPLFSMTSSASTIKHSSNKVRFCQQSTNVSLNPSTAQHLSDSVFHS